jgi:phosphate transport system ATP-binding protein
MGPTAGPDDLKHPIKLGGNVMGETLEDIARPEKRRSMAALVVKRTGDGVPHRAKVTIKNLDFFYGKTQALKQVCLTVPENQVTAMIGPSGCGKSTLLRVLNRIYSMYPAQRATGTVLLDGEDIIGPLVDLRRLRSRIGMVFQEITVFPMSIFGNVAFGTRLHEHLSQRELGLRVEEALTRAALWAEVKDRLQDPAAALSGGQQQRLGIARALSTRPEVLLLDEPTSALDPASAMKIENLIDELKLTMTIVLVTHNLQQAARCADQVAFFYRGEMIETGTAVQMFTNPQQVRTQNYITGRFG